MYSKRFSSISEQTRSILLKRKAAIKSEIDQVLKAEYVCSENSLGKYPYYSNYQTMSPEGQAQLRGLAISLKSVQSKTRFCYMFPPFNIAEKIINGGE